MVNQEGEDEGCGTQRGRPRRRKKKSNLKEARPISCKGTDSEGTGHDGSDGSVGVCNEDTNKKKEQLVGCFVQVGQK